MAPGPRLPTVVDLFAGAGGFSLGFKTAGCRVIAAVERDETAAATYLRNFSRLQPDAVPLVLTGDAGNIEDLEADRIDLSGQDLDILIGGPPCQGFSFVGRAKLESLSDTTFAADPRNDLVTRFLELVTSWRPRAVVMENVTGILSVEGRNIGELAARALEDKGYRAGFALLNAAWYGVPQYRERYFLIGIREDLGIAPSMPPATHRVTLPDGYLSRRQEVPNISLFDEEENLWLPVNLAAATGSATTVADALDDLPRLTLHTDAIRMPAELRLDRRHAYRSPPHSPFSRLMRRWPGLPPRRTVTDHEIRMTPRDFETFRRMPPGGRYPEALLIAKERLDERLRELARVRTPPEPGTPEYRAIERSIVPPYRAEVFVTKWRKLIAGQPSWTVPAHLAKDAYSHIHHDSEQARAISVREAARLQSFPDAFRFEGNMGERFTQVGNAVPPMLSWAFAAHLRNLLSRRGQSRRSVQQRVV